MLGISTQNEKTYFGYLPTWFQREDYEFHDISSSLRKLLTWTCYLIWAYLHIYKTLRDIEVVYIINIQSQVTYVKENEKRFWIKLF